MVEQYSRFDLTRDLYAMLLVCSFFIWRFLLKNPNNFCAFDVMLFMCAFLVMLDEMVIPRYFAVSTDSRVCPFKMQLNLKGVLERVTDRVTFGRVELHAPLLLPLCQLIQVILQCFTVGEVPNWSIQNSHQQRDEFVMIQLLVGH